MQASLFQEFQNFGELQVNALVSYGTQKVLFNGPFYCKANKAMHLFQNKF